MESNESKEIDTKDHTCHYLDVMIKNEDFDFDNILLDKKNHNKIKKYFDL